MKPSEVTGGWLRQQLARTGVGQKRVADVLGLGEVSKVSKMVNGRRGITAEEAELLIAFFDDSGSSVNHARSESSEDYVGIPRYDVQLSGGSGKAVFDSQPKDRIPFTRQFLERRLGRPDGADLVMFEAVGDSMEPTISNGDLVMVDRRDKTLSGGIMAFRVGEDAFIKRIIWTPNGVRIVSDNRAIYPESIISRSDFDQMEIFGRVCWIGRVI